MKSFFAVVFSMGLGALPMFAQVPGAVDQVDKFQQQRERSQTVTTGEGETAPELFSGETSDVGPQSVLRLKPRRSWFEAQADVQYYFTDDLFPEAASGKLASAVVLSTVQLAVAPTPFEAPCGSYAPRVGYRHQWFSFGLPGDDYLAYDPLASAFVDRPLSDFDFNVSTAFADLTWSHEHWLAQIGFDLQRLLTSSDYDEFYREYVPRWRLQRSFAVCEKSALAIGYEGNYRFTDDAGAFVSNYNDRTDHSLYATYTYALCSHAVIQPYYRFKYTRFADYFGQDRNDTLHSFGLGLYWLVCPNFNVRFFGGYEVRNSDVSFVRDYNRFDVGGGLNVNVRF